MGIFLPTTVSAEDTAAIVERKLQWILSACHPLEVWLFGSAATGEMTEASDIDLILLFEDAVAIREAQRVLARTPRLDGWPQDLLWYLRSEFYEQSIVGGVPMIAVEDGRRIYRRECS
jgi:predicted nucleotidyltransferase